ncbi:MAG: GNAT family N-acetyltransferase [Methyloligellaceae bacterium]
MSFSLFGGKKKEPALRPMKRSDLSRVVDIINEHDEDDAEEAYESLSHSIEGMFVLDESGGFSLDSKSGVIGVIGARQDPDVQDICWLSWTYVTESRQGEGWGRMMMEEIIEMLKADGIRKLFITTSDYEEDGEDIYAEAKKLYTSMGAKLELTVPEFHDEEEAQLIYGLPLIEEDSYEAIEPITGTLEFYDVNPMAESEMGFILGWRVHDEDEDIDHIPPVREQLKHYRQEGIQHKARFLLATLPSDVSSSAEKELHEARFDKVGHLKDFHAPGLHEEYWVQMLK